MLGKKQTAITIDWDLYLKLKEEKINLSQEINEYLKIKLGKKEETTTNNINLDKEIIEKTDELIKLKKIKQEQIKEQQKEMSKITWVTKQD